MSKFLTPFLSFVLFILNVFCVSESMISNCWNWCRVMTDDANFDQSGIILADFNLVHRRHWPFEILITEMWYSLVLYLHDLINEMRYVKIITYRYDIHFSSEKSNKKNRKKNLLSLNFYLRTQAELIPANIYLFKVNSRNTRKKCKICSKLTMKTP